MVDYGTGSGVLGICCLLKGAACCTTVLAVLMIMSRGLMKTWSRCLGGAWYRCGPPGTAGSRAQCRLERGQRLHGALAADGMLSPCLPWSIRFAAVQTALVPAAVDDTPASAQYDVCVANILKGPLLELAPTLAAHTRPGGLLGLSGILVAQVQQVQAAYTVYFDSFQTVRGDKWALLTAVRRTD